MQDSVAQVLIVDDSHVNRLVIDKYLRAEPYSLSNASDGEEALNLLNKDPDFYDVILLDLIMPKMDGMTLIRHIKGSDLLSHIPVIIQSGLWKPAEISAAVQAGAFYYLVKPVDKYELISIVRTAVQDMVEYRRQQRALDEIREVRCLLVSSTFNFKTPEEGLALAVYLAKKYLKPEKVVTGIQELFLNAVEHGNLGITYDEKTTLNDENKLKKEVTRRLALPEYKDKRVVVRFAKSKHNLVLTVTDEGEGFNWQEYMEVAPERITHNHGRGIAMANLLAFDTLTYIGKGNVVKACSNID